MSLLKQLLIGNKFLELEEEVDAFIEKNEVEPGSQPQRLEFKSESFPDEANVNDFMMSHVFTDSKIESTKGGFEVKLIDQIGFIETTLKTIEIRDGVSLVVGVLKPMSSDNPILFDDKTPGTIKLSTDVPYVIELANVVNGFHVNFGEVSITKSDLISFRDNFINGVVGVDLSIDFDHETREAAGWIKEVFLSEDGNTLLGLVKWTPKGAVSLTDREFRYLSPEFHPNWVHPHTGKAHGPTLLGAGLVNRPFLKMDAIVGLKNKSNSTEVPKMDTVTMADHNKKIVSLKEDIDALRLSEAAAVKTAKTLNEKVVTLSEENKSLKESAEKKEKEAKHNLLFTEGKINKAQLEALNEGKDMLEVLSLTEKMNLDPKGKVINDDDKITLSDAEINLCAKMGLTHEEFISANKEA